MELARASASAFLAGLEFVFRHGDCSLVVVDHHGQELFVEVTCLHRHQRLHVGVAHHAGHAVVH
jgi:hypothetical protein